MPKSDDGKTLPSGLLDAASCCRRLGGIMSKKRLEDLSESGHMPHWKVDGRPLYQPGIVKKWIRDNLTTRHDGSSFHKVLHIRSVADTTARCVPPQLLSIADSLHSLPFIRMPPAVYFLTLNNEVVYVGQSVGLFGRIEEHTQHKEFDSVYFLPVPRSELNEVEAAFIRALRPKLNTGNPCFDMGNDHQIIDRYRIARKDVA